MSSFENTIDANTSLVVVADATIVSSGIAIDPSGYWQFNLALDPPPFDGAIFTHGTLIRFTDGAASQFPDASFETPWLLSSGETVDTVTIINNTSSPWNYTFSVIKNA